MALPGKCFVSVFVLNAHLIGHVLFSVTISRNFEGESCFRNAFRRESRSERIKLCEKLKMLFAIRDERIIYFWYVSHTFIINRLLEISYSQSGKTTKVTSLEDLSR